MGHNITAIICRPELAAELAERAEAPAPTSLPQGWAIVALGERQLDALAGETFTDCADGFTYLSSTLERLLAEASTGAALVYLETGYFGGFGSQGAALFRDGRLVSRRAEGEDDPRHQDGSPISLTLRDLGVKAGSAHDEFDALELGRYRDVEALGVIWDDED